MTDTMKPTQTTFGVVYIADVHLTQSECIVEEETKAFVKSDFTDQC